MWKGLGGNSNIGRADCNNYLWRGHVFNTINDHRVGSSVTLAVMFISFHQTVQTLSIAAGGDLPLDAA